MKKRSSRRAAEIANREHFDEKIFYCPQEVVQRKSVAQIRDSPA
ncbi:MAG: hypothetical protein PUK77_05750 [bacterium]|nr:hypothetical protein [bacterium]